MLPAMKPVLASAALDHEAGSVVGQPADAIDGHRRHVSSLQNNAGLPEREKESKMQCKKKRKKKTGRASGLLLLWLPCTDPQSISLFPFCLFLCRSAKKGMASSSLQEIYKRSTSSSTSKAVNGRSSRARCPDQVPQSLAAWLLCLQRALDVGDSDALLLPAGSMLMIPNVGRNAFYCMPPGDSTVLYPGFSFFFS